MPDLGLDRAKPIFQIDIFHALASFVRNSSNECVDTFRVRGNDWKFLVGGKNRVRTVSCSMVTLVVKS